MNTQMWKNLWAFLNQPIFVQPLAKIKPDPNLLERCWQKSCIQSEYDRHPEVPSVANSMVQIIYLERCLQKPCIRSGYDF
jgi:hypothetical protein